MRIRIIGDSLSLPGGPGDYFARALRAAGHQVVVDATGGWAMSYFNPRLGNSRFGNALVVRNVYDGTAVKKSQLLGRRIKDVAAEVLLDAAAFDADKTYFLLGTNDYAQNPTNIRAGAIGVLSALKGKSVVLLGPPGFDSSLRGGAVSTGVANVCRVLLEVFGSDFVDTRSLTGDILYPSQGRAKDGIHFAASGARKYGERLFQVVSGGGISPKTKRLNPVLTGLGIYAGSKLVGYLLKRFF